MLSGEGEGKLGEVRREKNEKLKLAATREILHDEEPYTFQFLPNCLKEPAT